VWRCAGYWAVHGWVRFEFYHLLVRQGQEEVTVEVRYFS
jgi:hypothetical protein